MRAGEDPRPACDHQFASEKDCRSFFDRSGKHGNAPKLKRYAVVQLLPGNIGVIGTSEPGMEPLIPRGLLNGPSRGAPS
jgi:hypothetical protein